MNRYLYMFGFETPTQSRNNTLLRDDEDSECVVIVAPSKEMAMNWGRDVSEHFVRELFRDPSVSWKAGEFAHWIEDDQARIEEAIRAGVAVVQHGQLPDFHLWVERHAA